MPDLPTPPTMPTAYPPPGQAPGESAPYSYTPPPPPGQPSDQAPGEQTAPYAYAPPPQGAPPQQGPYHPPGAPYPPPLGYTPPGGEKKSKTGLIIGIVAGALVLVIAVAIVGGLLLSRIFDEISDTFDSLDSYITEESPLITPAPPEPTTLPAPITPTPDDPTPTPDELVTPPPPLISDNELVGLWEFQSGDWIYYFGQAELVMFIDYDDGTFGVFESDYEEWGVWYIDDDDYLVVIGDFTGQFEFTYILDGDELTITDRDGDTAHYLRVG